MLSNHPNALALLSRAANLSAQTLASLPTTPAAQDTSALTLEITSSQASSLQAFLKSEIYRHQALVDLHKFHANAATAAAKNMDSAAPLVQRLNDFPTPGVSVDLKKLVNYPPRIEPVPLKPLFFDVAWNYVEYPGRSKQMVEEVSSAVANGVDIEPEQEQEQPKEEKKRGWFGFGR